MQLLLTLIGTDYTCSEFPVIEGGSRHAGATVSNKYRVIIYTTGSSYDD